MTRRRRRGFTLVEAVISLGLGGFVVASSVALYSTAQRKASAPAREFVAFSIAEQKMELLSSVPRTSPLLDDTATGDVYDPSPTAGVDGPAFAKQFVNELGDVDPDGRYRVYWKITNPFGTVKRVVLYVEYPSPTGVDRVQIETFR